MFIYKDCEKERGIQVEERLEGMEVTSVESLFNSALQINEGIEICLKSGQVVFIHEDCFYQFPSDGEFLIVKCVPLGTMVEYIGYNHPNHNKAQKGHMTDDAFPILNMTVIFVGLFIDLCIKQDDWKLQRPTNHYLYDEDPDEENSFLFNNSYIFRARFVFHYLINKIVKTIYVFFSITFVKHTFITYYIPSQNNCHATHTFTGIF